jgi:hypothetical protein
MTRSSYALLALAVTTTAGVLVSSCNTPTCGPGTIQRQAATGELQCVPVDVPQQLIQCDVDGGNAEIIAGKCVSHIKCDPNSTMYDPASGICVGTGGGGCPPCPATPGAGKICLTGEIYDFVSNKKLADGDRTMRIAAYEPLSFLGNSSVAPLAEIATTNKNCYTIDGIGAPGAGLVAIGVSDPVGTATQVLALAGAGALVTGNKSYRVDLSVVTRKQVDDWSAAAGVNFDAQGMYIGLFFNDPVPDRTNLVFGELNPVAGVQITADGTPLTMAQNVKYLDPTRDKIGAALTATGALGIGVAPPPSSSIVNFSGKGGTCKNNLPCKFESHPGGSTAHVVFIDRFHDCNQSPTASTCM